MVIVIVFVTQITPLTLYNTIYLHRLQAFCLFILSNYLRQNPAKKICTATHQTLILKGFKGSPAIPCSLFPLWGAVVVAPQNNPKTPKKKNQKP